MRNFQDIFPGLSRTKVLFQDFPGPGIFKKKNPGLSRRRGNPDQSARMLKITNDSLTRSGRGCFIAVPNWPKWASKG